MFMPKTCHSGNDNRTRSSGVGALGECSPHAATGCATLRIILEAAKGQKDKEIAQSMEVNRKTVALWRQRFFKEGPDCLWEVAPGRGRKPRLSADKVEGIINTTLRSRPAGATHWSCRTMAEQQGCQQGNGQPDLAKPRS